MHKLVSAISAVSLALCAAVAFQPDMARSTDCHIAYEAPKAPQKHVQVDPTIYELAPVYVTASLPLHVVTKPKVCHVRPHIAQVGYAVDAEVQVANETGVTICD